MSKNVTLSENDSEFKIGFRTKAANSNYSAVGCNLLDLDAGDEYTQEFTPTEDISIMYLYLVDIKKPVDSTNLIDMVIKIEEVTNV